MWRNHYKLKRHRDVAENLKAMATAEITAIDERVEVLVAAYDQLLLKLVYDGTPPATAATDGMPPVVPNTAGGAPQAACGHRRRPWMSLRTSRPWPRRKSPRLTSALRYSSPLTTNSS